MRRIALSALYINGPSGNSSSEPQISQKMKKKKNEFWTEGSGVSSSVFYSKISFGSFGNTAFQAPWTVRDLVRIFDATDYQPISKQEGLLKISIEILFGARYQLI